MAAKTRDFSPHKVQELFSPFLRGGKDEKLKSQESGVDPSATTDSSASNEDSSSFKPPVSIPSHRDREAYLIRVRSYSSLTWFAKPEWLCPLQCARYGWENAGSDLLQCVTCRAYMSGRNASTMLPQVYDEYCRRLEGLLIKKHHSMCPWRTNPVPEPLMSVPVLGYCNATSKFLTTVQELLTMGEKLPRLPSDALQSQGLTCSHAEKLKSLYLKLSKAGDQSLPGNIREPSLNPDVQCSNHVGSASVLAVCGWKARRSGLKMIVCEDCNREVGLWNFLSLKDEDNVNSNSSEIDNSSSNVPQSPVSSKEGHLNTGEVCKSPGEGSTIQEVSTTSCSPDKEGKEDSDTRGDNGSTEEPVRKKAKTKDAPKTHFNPLSEHRSFCPWVATGPPQKCLTARQKSSAPSRSPSSSLLPGQQNNSVSESSPTVSPSPSQVNAISSSSPSADAPTSLAPPEGISLGTEPPGEEDLKTVGDWPGWHHRLQSLLPELSPEKSIRAMAKKSPRHASLRCIREMLYGWVSPLTDTEES